MNTNEHVLRCCRTGRYWVFGEWTPDPDRAETFNEETAALAACRKQGLQGVELITRTILSNHELSAVRAEAASP